MCAYFDNNSKKKLLLVPSYGSCGRSSIVPLQRWPAHVSVAYSRSPAVVCANDTLRRILGYVFRPTKKEGQIKNYEYILSSCALNYVLTESPSPRPVCAACAPHSAGRPPIVAGAVLRSVFALYFGWCADPLDGWPATLALCGAHTHLQYWLGTRRIKEVFGFTFSPAFRIPWPWPP